MEMLRKLVGYLLIVIIIASWPISLWQNKPKLVGGTIFYEDKEDTRIRMEKLGLDTSYVKAFFYNKYSDYTARYRKNFFVLLDPANYFFKMHPREDVVGVDFRNKYPYFTIVFLVVAIIFSAYKNKNLMVWASFFIIVGMLSFLRHLDGWDFVVYFPFSYLLVFGVKEVFKI